MAIIINSWFKVNSSIDTALLDSSWVKGSVHYAKQPSDLVAPGGRFQDKEFVEDGNLVVCNRRELWQALYTDSSILWSKFAVTGTGGETGGGGSVVTTGADGSVIVNPTAGPSIVYADTYEALSKAYKDPAKIDVGVLGVVGGKDLYEARLISGEIEWVKSRIIPEIDDKGSAVIYVSTWEELSLGEYQDRNKIQDGNLAVIKYGKSGKQEVWQGFYASDTPAIIWEKSKMFNVSQRNIVVDSSGNWLDNVYFDEELSQFSGEEMEQLPDEFIVVSSSTDLNEFSKIRPSWDPFEAIMVLQNAVVDMQRKMRVLLRTFDNGLESGNIADVSANAATSLAYGHAVPQPMIDVSPFVLGSGDEVPEGEDPVADVSMHWTNENGEVVEREHVIYNDNILDSCVYPYTRLGSTDRFDAETIEEGIDPFAGVDVSDGTQSFINPGALLYGDSMIPDTLDSSGYIMPLKHIVLKVADTVEIMNMFKQYLYPNELVICIANNTLYRYDIKRNRMVAMAGGSGGTVDPSADSSTDIPDTSTDIITMDEIIKALTDGSVNQIVLTDINNSAADAPKYTAGISNGQWKISRVGGAVIPKGTTTSPARLASTSPFVGCSTLQINEVYANDNASILANADHDVTLPCSHNFVEIANLDPHNAVDLSTVSLQYLDPEEKWHFLQLRGVIEPGSTFLVRGARTAPSGAPSTVIDVTTYDMEWYENGRLIAFNNAKGALYVTLETSVLPDASNPAVKSPMPANNNYIDMFGWGPATWAYADNAKPFTVIGQNKLYVRKWMMDRSKQGGPQAITNRDCNKFMDFVDLKAHNLGNEKDFRPRATFEKKNVYTTRSFFREDHPYCVTVAFGIDAVTTRTFNWISTQDQAEYVFYRLKGSNDPWNIKESYYEGDGMDAALREIPATYTRYQAALSAAGQSAAATSDSPNYTIHIPAYDRIKWETSGQTFVTTHKVILKNGVTTEWRKSGDSYVKATTVLTPSLHYYTDNTLRTESGTRTQFTKGTEYEFKVGPAVYDQYGIVAGPDDARCSDVFYFQVRPAVTDAEWSFVQHTDEQGFRWQDYECWRRSADQIRALHNPEFTIDTGDMTQNGNRLSEWIDFYNGGLNIWGGRPFSKRIGQGSANRLYENESAGIEQMNVVGNNDLAPIQDYLLGDGNDSINPTQTEGKCSPKQFLYFYCYELDPENLPVQYATEEVTLNWRDGAGAAHAVQDDRTYIKNVFPSTYSFNYNNCHFTAICSELTQSAEYNIYGAELNAAGNIASHNDTNDAILRWMEADLCKYYKFSHKPGPNATYPWAIVFMHEMPYTILTEDYMDKFKPSDAEAAQGKRCTANLAARTGGSKLNDNTTRPFETSEIIQRNHVRLVIGGHKHTHSQTWPLFENVTYKTNIWIPMAEYSAIAAQGPIDIEVTDVSTYRVPGASKTYCDADVPDRENYRIVGQHVIQPWEVNTWVIENASKFERNANSAQVYFTLPADAKTDELDSTAYNVYKREYTSTDAADRADIFYDWRWQGGGIPLVAAEGGEWAPIYVMSQATSQKVVSNKEKPTIGTPWMHWYYPTTPGTGSTPQAKAGSEAVQKNQQYPHFVKYVFTQDGENSANMNAGTIKVYHYAIYEPDFANDAKSAAFFANDEFDDILASKARIQNATGSTTATSKTGLPADGLGVTIKFLDQFLPKFHVMTAAD